MICIAATVDEKASHHAPSAEDSLETPTFPVEGKGAASRPHCNACPGTGGCQRDPARMDPARSGTRVFARVPGGSEDVQRNGTVPSGALGARRVSRVHALAPEPCPPPPA